MVVVTAAAGAVVLGAILAVERAGAGALGAFFAQHRRGLRRQAPAPFVLAQIDVRTGWRAPDPWGGRNCTRWFRSALTSFIRGPRAVGSLLPVLACAPRIDPCLLTRQLRALARNRPMAPIAQAAAPQSIATGTHASPSKPNDLALLSSSHDGWMPIPALQASDQDDPSTSTADPAAKRQRQRGGHGAESGGRQEQTEQFRSGGVRLGDGGRHQEGIRTDAEAHDENRKQQRADRPVSECISPALDVVLREGGVGPGVSRLGRFDPPKLEQRRRQCQRVKREAGGLAGDADQPTADGGPDKARSIEGGGMQRDRIRQHRTIVHQVTEERVTQRHFEREQHAAHQRDGDHTRDRHPSGGGERRQHQALHSDRCQHHEQQAPPRVTVAQQARERRELDACVSGASGEPLRLCRTDGEAGRRALAEAFGSTSARRRQVLATRPGN